MKKEYISPDIAYIGLSTGDIMNFSINAVGGDIGENLDGNVFFMD